LLRTLRRTHLNQILAVLTLKKLLIRIQISFGKT